MIARTPEEIQVLLDIEVDGKTTDELRQGIDDLDSLIAEALITRSKLSHEVQRQRVAGGGCRINLSRERQVYENYAKLLGSESSDVTDAVLRYCRGSKS